MLILLIGNNFDKNVAKQVHHDKGDDILFNWEACMIFCKWYFVQLGGLYVLQFKEDEEHLLVCPLSGVLKFNVDGAAKGKPGLAGIGRALRDDKGVVMCMFSKM